MVEIVKDRPLEAQRKERITDLAILAKKLLSNKTRKEVIFVKLKQRAKKEYLVSDNAARDYSNTALNIAQSE